MDSHLNNLVFLSLKKSVVHYSLSSRKQRRIKGDLLHDADRIPSQHYYSRSSGLWEEELHTESELTQCKKTNIYCSVDVRAYEYERALVEQDNSIAKMSSQTCTILLPKHPGTGVSQTSLAFRPSSTLSASHQHLFNLLPNPVA